MFTPRPAIFFFSQFDRREWVIAQVVVAEMIVRMFQFHGPGKMHILM